MGQDTPRRGEDIEPEVEKTFALEEYKKCLEEKMKAVFNDGKEVMHEAEKAEEADKADDEDDNLDGFIVYDGDGEEQYGSTSGQCD